MKNMLAWRVYMKEAPSTMLTGGCDAVSLAATVAFRHASTVVLDTSSR
jgi:hypothetical protein